ncbi:MAG: SEC-C metal-binding domain-containing protein [Clostridia bacterium]|nr:SEC-C metal-binding domain-containing protein [Clostridia bacterium]
MSLYESWKELAGKERSQVEYNKFWEEYFLNEKNNYENILENKKQVIAGKLNDVAGEFNMDAVTFTGFIDGINTSLVQEIDMDSLTEDSDIKLEIDFEKLYFNMLDAKAEWLYNLPQWEGILSEEKRKEIAKEFNKSRIAVSNKVGRNDPCPCGSGKKYKKCCGVNT